MSEENVSILQNISSLIDRYRDSKGNLDYFAMLGDQSVVAYAESLVKFDLDSLQTRNEQLAFWINCYNALSIYGVIRKLKSNPKFAKSGNKGWFQRVRFFAFQKFNVGGKDYTLRGIENFIRSEFKEPRIHFALNCSAMGCPLLKNGLYSANNLDNELEEAARLYIQSERGTRLNKDGMQLHLSMIFKWYPDDFKVTNMSIVQYVAKYHQEDTAQFLLDNENDLDIRYIDYDFALNLTKDRGGLDMRRGLRDTMFGLKKVSKYLTDSELRKAYAEFKESEEMAFRLIVNSMLEEGWLVALSRPKTAKEIAQDNGYTNQNLLNQILKLLSSRGVIVFENGQYRIEQIRTEPIRPEDVGTVLANFYYDCASILPAALCGNRMKLDDVPRVVLEAVFSSRLTEVGRGVLLRSFSPKNTKEVGVAAFADVGLPFAIRQLNAIYNPDAIHLMFTDYRWLSPVMSILRLISDETATEKIRPHLFGLDTNLELDLLYGEEFFAWEHKEIESRVKTISELIKPGGRLVTNDPTITAEEEHKSPAYVLMQTIEGYPQPLQRNLYAQTLERHSLEVHTIGENWTVAEKVVST